MSWDGLVSLHDQKLCFELKTGGGESLVFEVPLAGVSGAEFQRGLVNRKLALKVDSEELRDQFPAGVTGGEVHLMVAREDRVFGGPSTSEEEYERLVSQIVGREASPSSSIAKGLPS